MIDKSELFLYSGKMYQKPAPLELAEFFEQFKRYQLKITPRRTAIYYALTSGKAHPSSE